jgi:hypothetical protein
LHCSVDVNQRLMPLLSRCNHIGPPEIQQTVRGTGQLQNQFDL